MGMRRAPRFVLDASVTLAWHFVDEDDDYANAVAAALNTTEALTPSLWLLEVGNTALIGERTSRPSHRIADAFFKDLRALPITVDYDSLKTHYNDCCELARKTKLTLYDAAYLELAVRHRLPLATLDGRLAKAAAECGVKRFTPPGA